MRSFFVALLLLLTQVLGTCVSSIHSDIVFVLDSSGSISYDDWEVMLAFVSELVSTGIPADSRVGSVVYGSYSSEEFGLDSFSSLSAVAQQVLYSYKIGGYTYTRDALSYAKTNIFDQSVDNTRAKTIVLITDGQPSDNPCRYANTLKNNNIGVVIIAVGDWLGATNMECLVDDPNTQIIEIGKFNELDGKFDLVEEVVCANDFLLQVVEIQPFTGFTGVSASRFIEVYNKGGERDLYGVEFKGLFKGTIVSSLVLPQNWRLLVSLDDNVDSVTAADGGCSASNRCIFCNGNNQCSGFTLTDYAAQDSSGTPPQEFEQELYYNGGIVSRMAWNAAENFPKFSQAHSIEMLVDTANMAVGTNWIQSCDVGGSPGIPHQSDCQGCQDHANCQFEGDSSATCEQGGVCSCSTSFYPSGRSCTSVPQPTFCVLEQESGDDTRYVINWNNPQYNTELAFEDIEIAFWSGGVETKLKRSKPPMPAQQIDSDKVNSVLLHAIFYTGLSGNSTDGATMYSSSSIGCTVRTAPTMSPSSGPSPAPSSTPTRAPTLHDVPPIDSCDLWLSNQVGLANMTWTYTGPYLIDGATKDPEGFQLRYGEQPGSVAAKTPGNLPVDGGDIRQAGIPMYSLWDDDNLYARIEVLGEENGQVRASPSVTCTINAPPNVTTYPVPSPKSCQAETLPSSPGSSLLTLNVSMVKPDAKYVHSNASNHLDMTYHLRVLKNDFTNPTIIDLPASLVQLLTWSSNYEKIEVYSQGQQDGEDVESTPTDCDSITFAPTASPIEPASQWPVPPLGSCSVEITSGPPNSGDNKLGVAISWQIGDKYYQDGTETALTAVKYKLGGERYDTRIDTAVDGSETDTWDFKSFLDGKTTYMVAVGYESVGSYIGETQSNPIPCTIITSDPTPLPTRAPSVSPTKFPTRSPTGSPTFNTPEVHFRETAGGSAKAEYSHIEGDDPLEMEIILTPAAMIPVVVNWEIREKATGNVPTTGFSETNGQTTFDLFRGSYPLDCMSGNNTCIATFPDCVVHAGQEYCVQTENAIFTKVSIIAFDDSITDETTEYEVHLTAGGSYVNDEFYGNGDQYHVGASLGVAQFTLYDAEGSAFCAEHSEAGRCNSGSGGLETWHIALIAGMGFLVLVLIVVSYLATKYGWNMKRKNKVLKTEMDEEYRNQEEGFGVGLHDNVNPLAVAAMAGVQTSGPGGEVARAEVDEDPEDIAEEPDDVVMAPMQQFGQQAGSANNAPDAWNL